jgi:hypothetical protein
MHRAMRLATLMSLASFSPLGHCVESNAPQARNLILFVPDGLRSHIVDDTHAPNLAKLRKEGVDFRNSHSLFPTFTTANASALATGHGLGDTADFSNTIFVGFPVNAASGTYTPFLEDDAVLREVTKHFGGNYLGHESIMALADRADFATAAIGKVGPIGIQSLGALNGSRTLIVDDTTGSISGPPLAYEWSHAMTESGLPFPMPSRMANGKSAATPGALAPNYAQQQYFLETTLTDVLPVLKKANPKRPFFIVYWSRDPDGTQHNQGDNALNHVGRKEGINGLTSLAAVRVADNALGAIREQLKQLGLEKTTDIVVAADHGFSTICKTSATSPSAQPGDDAAASNDNRNDNPVQWAANEKDCPGASASVKKLPTGFLAMDLASHFSAESRATNEQSRGGGTDEKAQVFGVFDNTDKGDPIGPNSTSFQGSAKVGINALSADVVVAANGGSDLIYLTNPDADAAAAQAKDIVSFLTTQDYVGGIFVDTSALKGPIAGALSLKDIGLAGSRPTGTGAPMNPSIVVAFKTWLVPCNDKYPELCAFEVADTSGREWQGMHGSFGRADTFNFAAAVGPSFKKAVPDDAPVSNADIGMTIAHILHLSMPAGGELPGRVLEEALLGGPNSVKFSHRTLSSTPSNGRITRVQQQCIGERCYSDSAEMAAAR